jgi:hypothetical protein
MIHREYGKLVFECDAASCNEVLETNESDFNEAHQARRQANWPVRQVRPNSWLHFCSERCANS